MIDADGVEILFTRATKTTVSAPPIERTRLIKRYQSECRSNGSRNERSKGEEKITLNNVNRCKSLQSFIDHFREVKREIVIIISAERAKVACVDGKRSRYMRKTLPVEARTKRRPDQRPKNFDTSKRLIYLIQFAHWNCIMAAR